MRSVVCGFVFLISKQKKNINIKLVGAAAILTGGYFLIYDLVSVWDPIYRDFLSLTDFWMMISAGSGRRRIGRFKAYGYCLDQFSVVKDGKDYQQNRPSYEYDVGTTYEERFRNHSIDD